MKGFSWVSKVREYSDKTYQAPFYTVDGVWYAVMNDFFTVE